MICSKALVAAALAAACVAGTSHAAKAPHVPGVVTESTMVIGGYVQDLSTNPLVVTNTEYESFTPIDTSLAVDLVQDYKGNLTGTADFGSTHETGGASFTVTGKAKMSKIGPGFKLKGTASIGGAEGKTKKAKLTVTATMIGFDGEDLNPQDQDYTSIATYRLTVKATGLGRNYSYTKDVQLKGNFHFVYDLAPEEDVKYLKDKPDSDYYYLYTPWGVELADGTFQVIGADGYFTIKAPKFAFTGTDFDYDGIDFSLDYGAIKSGLGKFEGPFLNDEGPEPAAAKDAVPAGAAIKIKQALFQ